MIIRRKPTKKEIFFGCMEFLKIMLIGFFTFDVSDMLMGWEFFKLTAQGKFEISEEVDATENIQKIMR